MSVDAAEIKVRVARIMSDTRFKGRHRYVNLWTFVLTREIQCGTQFLCAQPGGQNYIVLGETREVVRISKRGGDRWHAYFATMYGLTHDETEARFVYQHLRAYVATQGTKAELRRFAAYNATTLTCYLSAYNGRMFKLDGENVLIEPNGEDSIFFADDDGGIACAPNIAAHGVLFDRITNLNYAAAGLGGITPEQQRMAFIVWLFALAFPDLMPTKPLLLLEGAQGAGKSAGVVLAEMAIMGHDIAMQLEKSKPDDFGVVLLRRPMAIFDNVDSYVDWVPDAICAYATGAKWTRRKLYTDDEHMEIRPHAFIAIASKNPASFRREDTVDRTIVMRLERREAFRRLEALKREILDERNLLFGEYLWYCNRIVAELRAQANIVDEQQESHRMADFAALARVVGNVLNWPQDEVADMMTALQNERDAFANEDDPLLGILERWLDYKHRFGAANRGRLISAVDLNTELETLAGAGHTSSSNTKWKLTPRILAQKIRSSHILKTIRVETTTVNGVRMYRLFRATDPKIEVLDGGIIDVAGTE